MSNADKQHWTDLRTLEDALPSVANMVFEGYEFEAIQRIKAGMLALATWCHVDNQSNQEQAGPCTLLRLALCHQILTETEDSWPAQDHLESKRLWRLERRLRSALAVFRSRLSEDPKHDALAALIATAETMSPEVKLIEELHALAPENRATLLWDPEHRCLGKVAEYITQIILDTEPAEDAVSPSIKAYETDGTLNLYAGIPKILSSVAWSVGGAGRGETIYATAPVVRYQPRALELMPIGRRAHQQRLTATVYETGVDYRSLIPHITRDVSALLGAAEAKLVVYFMLTGDHVSTCTAGEIAATIWPTKSRLKPRDYDRLVMAIRLVRWVMVGLPDNTDIQLFDIRAPIDDSVAPFEQTLTWSYSGRFKDLLRDLSKKTSRYKGIKALNGDFMINYSAFMSFEGRQERLMRAYLLACSIFNDSQGAGYQVPRYTKAEWAAHSNSLSQAAIEHLERTGKSTNSGRKATSKDVARAWQDLEELEGLELIELEKVAPDKYAIKPPREWQDAYKNRRKHGLKPATPE